MDLSDESRQLLSEMASVVRELDKSNALANFEPIDVAKGLVAIYDQLPPWVGCTQRLSADVKRLRQLFKQANDPNKLVFDDIPKLLRAEELSEDAGPAHSIAQTVLNGLLELREAYSAMLNRMQETLLAELQVPNASPAMLAELRTRAANILGIGGDHRQEAFIVRLSQYEGRETDIEGLAGMAVNKPPRTWVDLDIDRATVELARMARRFVEAESFAHVKGRRDKRHAMAVIVGMDGQPTAIHKEFQIADHDHDDVKFLIKRVDGALRDSGEERRDIILAALAELSAKYLDQRVKPRHSRDRRRTAS